MLPPGPRAAPRAKPHGPQRHGAGEWPNKEVSAMGSCRTSRTYACDVERCSEVAMCQGPNDPIGLHSFVQTPGRRTYCLRYACRNHAGLVNPLTDLSPRIPLSLQPHEPVVVLFTRVAQDALRAHLISTWTSRIPKPTASAPAGPNPAQPSVLSNTERSRLKQLRRVVEETRDRINPRFLLVVSVNQPWTWTCVFLRSYQRLQPALHRLCPAAAQVVAERKLLPAPSLLPLHDLTPGADVLQRLRARTANTLRPLLQWMADEDMESSSERVPVLYVATDVHELAERFVSQLLAESGPRAAVPEPFTASGEASGRGDGRGAGAREAVGEGAAEGLVRRGVSLAELADGELQRVLLARDRLYEVLEALQPRVLLLVNWLSPGQMVAVLYRWDLRACAGQWGRGRAGGGPWGEAQQYHVCRCYTSAAQTVERNLSSNPTTCCYDLHLLPMQGL